MPSVKYSEMHPLYWCIFTLHCLLYDKEENNETVL